VKRFGVIVVAALILSGIGCASSTEPATTLSPADLVASLADVANGRNADLLETGLALKTIELKLVVGRERRGGARVSFLVLDAAASRRSETSFMQSFTLELPPPERRRTVAETPGSGFPSVAEFVDAAIAAARELANAASRAGLPQRLREVELTARIVRSSRAEGGIAFTAPAGSGAGGSASRAWDETNTVRLVFTTR
jgi:hypothetical protein